MIKQTMASSKRNCHLGHLLLEGLSRNVEKICQIDAGTGKSETYASVLRRTISLARYLQDSGLKPGDVMALEGQNHLDVHIPHYAGLMTGLPVAAIDPLYKYDEINVMFRLTKPKIVFCDGNKYEDISRVVKEQNLDTKIVTFDDKGECTMKELIETYGNEQKEFRMTEFDSNKVFCWLAGTSGTTGVLKYAAVYHSDIITMVLNYKKLVHLHPIVNNHGDICSLNLSPVQWISAYYNTILPPIFGVTKVQTSAPITGDHIVDIINMYKPINTTMSPSLLSQTLKSSKKCDWTCFNQLSLTGSKVHNDIMLTIREKVGPKGEVSEIYGQTETLGAVLMSDVNGPLGNCGVEYPMFKIKLVDPETDLEIAEPHKMGEAWIKGPIFAGYYNMPEETEKSFSPDGYYKTGDLLYRDQNGYYFYVERLKMLINYRNHQVLPAELEDVIRRVDGVEDVAVTSVPDLECGELPVACVVRDPNGPQVTAEQIKQAVADQLPDSKHLRGGAFFLDSLPITSNGKVARGKLRQLVLNTTLRE